MAQEFDNAEIVRILKESEIRIPYDRMMVSLNCAVMLTQDVSLASTTISSSPVCEVFCDEYYHHLIPLVMEMVTGW